MNKKISTIITAGGSSLRFGENKLLCKLDNKTVIETTIEKFLDYSCEIIIPAKDDIKNFLLESSIYCDKIKFAPSGDTRQKSVYNALLECDNPDYVLIHDGARPFIKKEIIEKIIVKLNDCDAVVAGVMAVDTIKEIKEGKIVKTLDRTKIFQAQTPQGFGFELIKSAHNKYIGCEFTDDSSMVEALGADVFVVIADILNKKITTKDDLIGNRFIKQI